MKSRNGVDTFAERNSPSSVYELISQRVRTKRGGHTIDNTTIDKVGSGLESDSIAGVRALGMGGCSKGGGGRDCERSSRPLPQRLIS